MKKTAVVTGASGGMGIEIARALAKAGHRVVMACRNPEKANKVREALIKDTQNEDIEVVELDLTSLVSVCNCVNVIVERYGTIDLLMNNAGTMATEFEQTKEGFEKTVGVNYVSTFLFTNKLIPYIAPQGRIVNMLSCTYPVGRLDFPDFFTNGRRGSFWRLLIYSNTKLALLLFTFELADRVKSLGITVNAADPGVVSTDIISMQKWFDPLADVFFRPFIRKPKVGASTAVDLLLKEEYGDKTGYFCVSNKVKRISGRYLNHPQRKELWEKTEKILEDWL